MKQLRIFDLILILMKTYFRKGNVLVFYHCIGGAKDVPVEVEEVEIRETLLGDKVTIY